MNKKGFIDLEYLEEVNPMSYVLGVAGAIIAFFYIPYLGTGAGLGTRIIGLVLGGILCTIVAEYMFRR